MSKAWRQSLASPILSQSPLSTTNMRAVAPCRYCIQKCLVNLSCLPMSITSQAAMDKDLYSTVSTVNPTERE
uniref:Uncharacterized protein n=1 Tax=Arcella intermedia TaxID=1963864 RepID=A0A6B2LSN4_9EUKA